MSICADIGTTAAGVVGPEQGQVIPAGRARTAALAPFERANRLSSRSGTFLENWQSQIEVLESEIAVESDQPSGRDTTVSAERLVSMPANILEGRTERGPQGPTNEGVSRACAINTNACLTQNAGATKTTPTTLAAIADQSKGASVSNGTAATATNESSGSERGRHNHSANHADSLTCTTSAGDSISAQSATIPIAVPVPAQPAVMEDIPSKTARILGSTSDTGRNATAISDTRLKMTAAQIQGARISLDALNLAGQKTDRQAESSNAKTDYRTAGQRESDTISLHAKSATESPLSVRHTNPDGTMERSNRFNSEFSAADDAIGNKSAGEQQRVIATGVRNASAQLHPEMEGGTQTLPITTRIDSGANTLVAGKQRLSATREMVESEADQPTTQIQPLSDAGARVTSADSSGNLRWSRRGNALAASDIEKGHSQPITSGIPTDHSTQIARIAEAGRTETHLSTTSDACSTKAGIEETFTALDAGLKTGAETRVGVINQARTGYIRAEVGYQDPALGWIEVRGESSGGVVHATVIPSTPDAAHILNAHMAGLHSYLAENRTPVETVTLASATGNDVQYSGHSAGRDSSHGSGQHSGGENLQQTFSAPSRAQTANSSTAGQASVVGDLLMSAGTRSTAQGRLISVIA
jgi:hypothetical protein